MRLTRGSGFTDKPLFQAVPFGELGIGEKKGMTPTMIMMSVETADRYCDKPLGLKISKRL